MDKKSICEAMYALPGGVVVRRKKSYLLPVLIFLIGMALVVLYYCSELSANTGSSLIMAAGATVIIGILMICNCIFDTEGRPWHVPTNRPMRYEERFFPVESRNDVRRYVEEGSLKRILAADKSRVSGIAVAIYRTEDCSFGAMQAYEYVGYEYRPITPVETTVG